MGLMLSALGPTLPALARNTHTTLSDFSLIFVARGVGSIIGSILGGRLLDRIPANRVVVASVLGSLLLTAAVPLVDSLWALVGIIFIIGLGTGMLTVSGNALLIWLHGDAVPPFMNMLHFSYGVGTSITPLIIAQTLPLQDGLVWSYGLLALLALPAALFPLFLRSPRPLQPEVNAAPRLFRPDLVALLTLIFFGYAAASYAVGGWIFTYATRMQLFDETSAAYLTSVYWGALTVGRLVSIPLAARLKPNRILLIDILGALAFSALMALLPGSPLALVVGTAGLGFFLATIFPTTMSLAGRVLAINGKVTSIFSSGSSLGTLFVPWLVGQYFESVGPQVLTTLLMVDLGVALGVYALLTRKIKQVEGFSQGSVGQ